jgi:hypothetical protein
MHRCTNSDAATDCTWRTRPCRLRRGALPGHRRTQRSLADPRRRQPQRRLVNGERIDEATLNASDQIRLGNTTFRFDETPVPGQQATDRSRVTIDASKRFLPVAQIADAETCAPTTRSSASPTSSARSSRSKLLQQIDDETFQIIRADRAVINGSVAALNQSCFA